MLYQVCRICICRMYVLYIQLYMLVDCNVLQLFIVLYTQERHSSFGFCSSFTILLWHFFEFDIYIFLKIQFQGCRGNFIFFESDIFCFIGAYQNSNIRNEVCLWLKSTYMQNPISNRFKFEFFQNRFFLLFGIDL